MAVVVAACGSDGPLVVRDPNPSLVQPTSPPATDGPKVRPPDESTDENAGRSDGGIRSRSGGSATVLLAQDSHPLTGWTPWDHVCAWSCRNVLDQVLETLTVVLPDGTTSPWLAERVESNPTMLNWTVTIREGLRFTDGKPVTAHVIKEGYEEFLKKGEVTRGLLRDARINAVKVLDKYSLMIDLAEPNPGLDVVLSGPIGRVFSVESAMADPAGFLRSPVGTGPYIIDAWEVGEPLLLVANRDYWRKDADGVPLPYLDRLVFRQVVDENERIESVRSRDADFAYTRSALAIERARDLELTVVSRNENNVGAVLFNTLKAPADDVRVRRALQLSTNQELLIKSSMGAGAGERATQWFAPESRWWSGLAAERWPKTNTAQAKELLAAYVDDVDRSDRRAEGSKVVVRLQCTDDIHLSSMTRELARQWEATGFVEVELETVTRNGLIQRVLGSVTDRPGFSGDFLATCWRFGGESDPAMMFAPLFGPVRTSPLNVTNLHDESLTLLVDLLHSSRIETVRQAAVEQLMLAFVERMPMIYLSHAQSALVGHSDTAGLGSWVLPDGTGVLGQVAGVGRWAEVWLPHE
ncbi:MAG: ABC transporter substrate-binding protein [Actinomycetota bacterium]|nr:ABC transporter substrate-binding protein [Actinomycetota bacterium]MEE2807041.1 ABC transporter substrate-binding protein [Actinomycetota bacterium]